MVKTGLFSKTSFAHKVENQQRGKSGVVWLPWQQTHGWPGDGHVYYETDALPSEWHCPEQAAKGRPVGKCLNGGINRTKVGETKNLSFFVKSEHY